MAAKLFESTTSAVNDPNRSTFHKNLGVPFGMPLLSCTGLAETPCDLWLGEKKGSAHSNEAQKVDRLLQRHPELKETKRLVICVGIGALDLAPLAHTLVIADIAPAALRATYLLTHALRTGTPSEDLIQFINATDALPTKRHARVSHEGWAYLQEILQNTKQ